LEAIFGLAGRADSVADRFLEDLEVFFLYNKYNVVKACLQCVVYGVVENEFTVRANRVKLL
jgi:hypothetical protein